jgi:2-hydroxycyclohexanecarboxyl-CoA dehydrogenase
MAVNIELSGKVAMITGSASGIGRETALLFARAGADIVVADLADEAANRVCREIEASGRKALPGIADVTDNKAVIALVDKALSTFGHIDILVNNAGFATTKSFMKIDTAEYTKDIYITLFSTLYCSKAVLPAMIERKYGKIVNTISDAGRVGERSQPVYSAAKGGVAAFTKALAKDMGRYNITVNGVSPSFTKTSMTADVLKMVKEEDLVKSYPLGRLGEPIDIANAILFLSSDLSSWITGQILSVNGGLYTV